MPPTHDPPILCQHPAQPLESGSREAFLDPFSWNESLPFHSILSVTVPKAFTSQVSYLESLYSLLSCEVQKGMGRFPLCFLQSCNTVLFTQHMLYKCLLKD